MVLDFYTVLETSNISKQLDFYRNFLGLDLIFTSEKVVGLGLYDELYLILREGKREKRLNSLNSDIPPTLVFKCQENQKELEFEVRRHGYKIVESCTPSSRCGADCLLIEDIDGNKVCLNLTG